jgi:hypothetical protein
VNTDSDWNLNGQSVLFESHMKTRESSPSNRDRSPSLGELNRSIEFDNIWQLEQDGEVGEEFELGDWASDDDAVLPRGKPK